MNVKSETTEVVPGCCGSPEEGAYGRGPKGSCNSLEPCSRHELPADLPERDLGRAMQKAF